MSNIILENKFCVALLEDLEKDKLILPTLPEIALQIQEVVADEEANLNHVAEIIGQDPAISARLIKVANSPLFRGTKKIETIVQAVTRMGQKVVKTMATNMALEQVFNARTPIIQNYMSDIWTQSTQVASIASVMAKHFTKLKPDQAMLAGLLHNIGSLPILSRAEEIPALLKDEEVFANLLNRLSGQIGSCIIQNWDFPDEIINVIQQHNNYEYDSDTVDYVDVVIVAKLKNLENTNHPDANLNWNKIPSFHKLGLVEEEEEAEELEFEGYVIEEIEITQNLFV